MGFPRQEYWSGFPVSSQGIFLTQGSNLCLLYRQADSSPLSHHRSPYAKALSFNIAFEDRTFGKLLCLDEAVRVAHHDGFVPL